MYTRCEQYDKKLEFVCYKKYPTTSALYLWNRWCVFMEGGHVLGERNWYLDMKIVN